MDSLIDSLINRNGNGCSISVDKIQTMETISFRIMEWQNATKTLYSRATVHGQINGQAIKQHSFLNNNQRRIKTARLISHVVSPGEKVKLAARWLAGWRINLSWANLFFYVPSQIFNHCPLFNLTW